MAGGRTDDLVHYTYSPQSHELKPRDHYGWICPRCGKALAPWVRGCVWSATAWPPQGRYFAWPYEHDVTVSFPFDSVTWWDVGEIP